MDDPICYEWRVITVATSMCVKCYSPKSFPSFKASLELSFWEITHARMQGLFKTSVQRNACNIFLGLLIHWICHLLGTSRIWLIGFLLVILFLRFQKTKFGCSYKKYGILFHKQTFKISLTRSITALIGEHDGYTKYWIQTLFFFPFCFENLVIYCTNTGRLCIIFHLILMILSWCCIF